MIFVSMRFIVQLRSTNEHACAIPQALFEWFTFFGAMTGTVTGFALAYVV